MALASALVANPVHVHNLHKREADPAVVYVVQTAVRYVDSKGNHIEPTPTESATSATESGAFSTNNPSANPTTTSEPTTTSGYTTTLTSSSASASTATATSTADSSNNGSKDNKDSDDDDDDDSHKKHKGEGIKGLLDGIFGDLSFGSSPDDFEDGVYKCSEFPVGQGVVSLDWVGFGGWASVMALDGSTSETCKDGFYCSYACQAGMSKTQWPTDQPADGRSVGGLLCKNGYLYKSNPRAEALCEWGTDTGYIENKVNEAVSLCRTDYPGSENMVVPTVVESGKIRPATVVDGDSYFRWQGGLTSTQYYVNNAGISVEKGCVWGTDGSGLGNWAPVVLGAGHTNGLTYLSIIPNPNNRTPPNYNIRIEASEGSTINGDCKYEDGVYSGSGSDGCTVTVTSGSGKFVFY